MSSIPLTHAEQERAYIESLPGVHHVQAAGRAYPKDNIAKGESYYHWSHPRWGTKRSKTLPRLSELTNGGRAVVLEAREGIQAATGDPEKLGKAVVSAALAMTCQASWYEERANELRELVENLETAVDELGSDAEALLDEPGWDEQ